MHEPHPQNGQPGWQMPSPLDILLRMVARIDQNVSEQNSRLGGLETGQKIGFEMMSESFDRHKEMESRIKALEVTVERMEPEAEDFNLWREVRASLPTIREFVVAMAVLAAAVGLIPDRHNLGSLAGSLIQQNSADRSAP